MKRQKFFNLASADRKGFPGDFLIFTLSVTVVLVATLYPFSFSFSDNFSLQEIIRKFDNSSFFEDQVNNVLLFMPLGFSLTSILQRSKTKSIVQFLTVLIFSAGLSLTIEVLQSFLPSRKPTPADIVNNSIGGIFGLICLYFWNYQSFIYKNSKTRPSTTKLTVFFIGYIFLTFLISIPWQNTTNLSSWDLGFPLLIGNERTGDRPWQGYVSRVQIVDKAISKSEVGQAFANQSYFTNMGNSLLASYQLNSQGSYQDQTGKLPELLWRGKTPQIEDDKGVALSSSQWLETAEPVIGLSKKLRETSEITINTTVATTNTDQKGPARIISLSSDPLRRNFTVGQDGNDLDFRIRTLITGANGANLKLKVPGVFADTKPHHIVITYSEPIVKAYVDTVESSYSLDLLKLIPKNQKLFYYALSFIPLGFCLALLTVLAKRRLMFYRLLLPSGILLPPFILESILANETGKHISLSNLLLGVLFTAGTMLMFRLRAAMVQKSEELGVRS